MPTTEYAKMAAALSGAVENGNGAILTSYGAQKNGYFGGVTLFPKQQPRVLDDGLGLRAKFHACEEQVSWEWPSWKTKVMRDTDMLLGDSHAYNAIVFRVNDESGFINAMAYCATEYEHVRKASDLHLRPYFRHEFAGPIRKAITSGQIRIVHPEGKIDELAVSHLNI